MENKMKTVLMIFFIISVIFFASCSESTTPNVNPNLTIIGELATPIVNETKLAKIIPGILDNEIDSIKIIRIRILMSRLLLFLENDNTTSGEAIKIEPFVYDLSLTGGVANLGNKGVPAGLYEKIKMEIHRFSSSELNQYAIDPVFMDFATEERNTILIEGITYNDGNPSTFVFKSNAVANLLLKFDSLINLANNSNTTVAISVDPNYFFKKWESIIDPNDPNNAIDIENSLINTIKAIKK